MIRKHGFDHSYIRKLSTDTRQRLATEKCTKKLPSVAVLTLREKKTILTHNPVRPRYFERKKTEEYFNGMNCTEKVSSEKQLYQNCFVLCVF